MSTIGYGDIRAVSEIEMVFVVISTIVSVGMFGYVLNSCTSILTNYNKTKEKYKSKLAEINKFMY